MVLKVLSSPAPSVAPWEGAAPRLCNSSVPALPRAGVHSSHPPALALHGQGSGHQSTSQHQDALEEPPGAPSTAPGHEEKLATWPTASPSPPGRGDLSTSPVPTPADGTGSTSGVPIRYWSPGIFVLVALLLLFFMYRRTKCRGSQDGATLPSDSSDLAALSPPQPPAQESSISAAPQGGRKGSEELPALELTQGPSCQAAPPWPQA
ncbi:mucin-1-like [Pogoniulus pusillus]|uniref:mucin-1-like n=1 Tax=Pogoniulus pusillus TaxID=488313 RepID=UPI0030B94FF6